MKTEHHRGRNTVKKIKQKRKNTISLCWREEQRYFLKSFQADVNSPTNTSFKPSSLLYFGGVLTQIATIWQRVFRSKLGGVTQSKFNK